jgi:outer membrane biosynthesis protein TonB
MAISGPTSGGGGGGGGFDPKATQVGAPPPPGDDESRGKSYTIYVIALGLAAAVLATFVAVAIGIAVVMSQQAAEDAEGGDEKPAVADGKDDDAPKDTGEKRDIKKSAPKAKPKPKPVEKAPEAAPAPAAPAKKAKDNFVIKNPSGEPGNSATVTCESGATGKAAFVDGKAVVKDIPTTETCKFSLRGGAPGGGKGRGGQTVTCDVNGGQVSCK